MQTRIPFEKNKKTKRAAHNSKRRFISESKFRRVLWPSMGSAALILILIFQLVHVSVPKSYSVSVIFSNFQKKN